jgi:hypothetical protein
MMGGGPYSLPMSAQEVLEAILGIRKSGQEAVEKSPIGSWRKTRTILEFTTGRGHEFISRM